MRRKDREISGRENILAIVNKCEYMTLALCDGGEPYAVTVNFGVLEKEGKLFLCFHCAKEGKKLDIIEKNNRVAFAMTAQYETVKNDLACKWTAKYQSATGKGRAFKVSEDEKEEFFNAVMKNAGGPEKSVFDKNAIKNTNIIKIEVEEISAKANI